MNPSLRTLASFQAGMPRLGGTSFVVTPGQGTWQLETRDGAVMNGGAAEHVREAIPVLASYCDALGIRAFAEGKDLAADLAEDTVQARWRGCAEAADQPGVGDQPSVPGAGRLEDAWTISTCRGAASSCCRWVYHPRALPLAVPAATLHMAAQRGMDVVVLRPEGFALPAAVMDKARAAAAAPAAR